MVTRKKQTQIFAALLIFTLVLSVFAPVASAAVTPGIRIPVRVELTGTPPSVDEGYTIVLEADNPAYPMPEGSAGGRYSMVITGEGSAALPEIIYSSLGIYTYSIYQLPGTDELATYDDRVYDLVVYVTNAEDGSGLVTQVILYLRGHESKLDEAVFENHYEVLTDHVAGSKTWIGGHPDSWTDVRLDLFRKTGPDGEEEAVDATYTTVKVEDNKWNYTWADLPMTDQNGDVYIYYVKEPAVPANYTSSADGMHVINEFDVGTRDVLVKKTWIEGPAERPDITIRLLADGTEVAHVVLKHPVTTHTFTGLPIYNPDGSEIAYTIQEDRVEGYTAVIEGFEVTNTWNAEDLPQTGASSTTILPLLGIMMTVAGFGLMKKRKSENK